MDPYSDDFVPRQTKENFPQVLTELRDDNAIQLNYCELLKVCKATEIIVTEEQAKAVESATREQASSKTMVQISCWSYYCIKDENRM